MQGLCSGLAVLVVRKFHSTKLLTFNEDLFFLYLLPPIIFNAGFDLFPFHHDDDQMEIKNLKSPPNYMELEIKPLNYDIVLSFSAQSSFSASHVNLFYSEIEKNNSHFRIK